jgi:hypothetical protein
LATLRLTQERVKEVVEKVLSSFKEKGEQQGSTKSVQYKLLFRILFATSQNHFASGERETVFLFFVPFYEVPSTGLSRLSQTEQVTSQV